MTDYRAVMDQVLKGWSVRQICSSSRCSHTTVQKARDALVEHNITTREQLRGVTDHELADWFVDGHNHTQVLSHPHLGLFNSCFAFGNRVLSAA